jgi:hypothetical protein
MMTPAPDNYCREVEAYLCRRNQGHLVRIVGPAFELVSGWATQGIPLSVVCAGIDRTVDRHDRKGPGARRRPVRIEFCEADVLDAFDAWRRAVGVATATPATPEASADADAARPAPRRPTLVSHIDRALARLTALRGSARRPPALDAALEQTVRALDGLRAAAPQARGEARATLVAVLRRLDRALMERAIETLDPAARVAADADTRQALAPYRDRMTADAYQRASAAAFERHVRDRCGLPVLTYDHE